MKGGGRRWEAVQGGGRRWEEVEGGGKRTSDDDGLIESVLVQRRDLTRQIGAEELENLMRSQRKGQEKGRWKIMEGARLSHMEGHGRGVRWVGDRTLMIAWRIASMAATMCFAAGFLT